MRGCIFALEADMFRSYSTVLETFYNTSLNEYSVGRLRLAESQNKRRFLCSQCTIHNVLGHEIAYCSDFLLFVLGKETY